MVPYLMTCMEIITAKTLGLGIVFFIFNDGELSQVSQGQKISYNKKHAQCLEKLR